MNKLKSFTEYLDTYEMTDEELYDKYDELVAHLIYLLSENVEILSEDIQETIFELIDVSNEIFGYDDGDDSEDDMEYDDEEDEAFEDPLAMYGNNGGYDENTTTTNVGSYPVPLRLYKRDYKESIEDDFEDDESELDEAVRRVKRNKRLQMQRRRLYKRNKAKIKRAQKKYRRTSAFRKYKKKKSRMAKRGKTSSGKRIRKFI